MADFRFSPRPNRAAEIEWRTWGAEAFAEANRAEKPVLLAISAVWCHWCHVMDETSYSDGEVIRLVNERFLPIRVDNDERPDVNRRYNMGGWPTTAFLTPDGEIIHGGTYVPPDQMRHTLEQVSDIWATRRDEIRSRITDFRAKEAEARASAKDNGPAAASLNWSIVDAIGSLIRGQYDPQFGGFGREPKFPQPALLRALLDEYRRHRQPQVEAMIHKTLGAMAGGGMYDHVEGGFFRYSTDREWRVPHFEKMLEENSELLEVYAEAHRSFPSAGYDSVVRDVIRWMDASLWRSDIDAFGGSQDADEVYYPLDRAGRATHEPPFVDRTFYTPWNALAASGYVAAAVALDDPLLAARAVSVLRSLLRRMRTTDGALLHYDRGEGPALADLLVDYAAVTAALLDAHIAGVMPEGLAEATSLAARARESLGDQSGAGFFDLPERADAGRLTQRERPIEDNAAMALSLLRIAALTGERKWRELGERTLMAQAGEFRHRGQFAASYARAVAFALVEPVTVVVVGGAQDGVAAELWGAAGRNDDPVALRQRLDPAVDAGRIARQGYPADRVAAYVCIGTTCSAPLGSARELGAALDRARGRLDSAPA